MYPVDRHLACFKIFLLLQTMWNTSLCFSSYGIYLEKELPEPGVGTVSPLLDIAQLLSKVYIYFHLSHVRRQISPHPHHLLALLDYNFTICEIESLCFDLNLHQRDYYSLRLTTLSIFS